MHTYITSIYIFTYIYAHVYTCIQEIIQAKMEVSIRLWGRNLGLSPKYDSVTFSK